MTRNVRKLFRQWLKKNGDQLPAAVELIRSRRKSDFYQIRGTPEIHLYVGGSASHVSIVVSAFYRGDGIDILFDTFVSARGSRRLGFECGFCEENPPARYHSFQELIETHGFEVLLDWWKENLRPENLLMMVADDGMSWARIVRPEHQRQIQETAQRGHPVFVVKPVVSGPSREV